MGWSAQLGSTPKTKISIAPRWALLTAAVVRRPDLSKPGSWQTQAQAPECAPVAAVARGHRQEGRAGRGRGRHDVDAWRRDALLPAAAGLPVHRIYAPPGAMQTHS